MRTEVIHGVRLDLARLKELLAGVPEADLVRTLPGAPNHPLWALGHLAFSMQAIAGELGVEPWLAADWGARYGPGSNPAEAGGGAGSASDLWDVLEDGVDRVAGALAALPAGALDGPLPDARFRSRYPTLGHAVVHVLGSHVGLHLGQTVCWLRALRAQA